MDGDRERVSDKKTNRQRWRKIGKDNSFERWAIRLGRCFFAGTGRERGREGVNSIHLKTKISRRKLFITNK